MCGNLLLPRASSPCSHLRGTDFGSAVARGLFPLTLTLSHQGRGERFGVSPTSWDDRLACYGFVGASSYLSASEPFSYNGLS